DLATRHFGWMHRDHPTTFDIFPKLQEIDESDGKRNGWWDKLTEFQRNAWKGVTPLKGSITIEHGPDGGRGLQIVKSSASWTDMQSSTRDKVFSYHLLRLRAKRDFGLRSNDAEL